MESASRTLPSPARAMAVTASSSKSLPTSRKIFFRSSAITGVGISLKSKRMQRDKIVWGILCTSVVARMKTACLGGSSSVFNSALNADDESMCTSSTI